MKSARVRFAALAVLTAALYIVGARLGLKLAFVAEQVTVVWPPTGIALCAVLLFGYRIWPAIAVGAFVANITTPTPLAASIGIAMGNTLEALAGAYLLNRFVKFRPSLERYRDIFGLIFFGAMVSTTISATFGVTSLSLAGIQSWERFRQLWSVWFFGDGMGDIIVAPMILTLSTAECRRRIRERGLGEFAVLLVVLTAVNLYVFGRRGSPGVHEPPDYAIFSVLIWAALRFGVCGTAVSGFLTATITVLGTVRGFGPFAGGSTNDNLIELGLFMFVAAVTGIILAISETQRNVAERLSRLNEDRYRSLVLASSQVVWSTTAAGEVVEDLPTWRTFTGQTAEETMGRGWARKLHPDDVPRVTEVWERSLTTGMAHEVEFRLLAADATYRNVISRAVPIRGQGGSIREWVGMLTDITEKKKTEREMQEANVRKDQFLAMLAHELRNPLAPIRNAIQVLRVLGPADPRLQSAREVIDRQIRHLTRLVDDLLDVSRITQGKVTLRKDNVELATIIAHAVETYRTVIDERRQHLEVSLPVRPLPVEGDPIRLEQIVGNLLNNASKYTEEGGRIWLSAERSANEIVVRIRDTGIGIPEDVLPHVFDLFSQANRSLDRSQGGLGIGLTLVRSMVEMHGGKVEAFSAGPGRGSEFIVTLPLLPDDLRHEEVVLTSNARPRPGRSLRILVVDDNHDAAESLSVLLEMSGHQLHIAHEGETALQTAITFHPQAVLLDIGLPGMDGYEVARHLREQPGMKECFLVALTGYGQEEDRRRSKEAGFDHHLVKPVDPDQLDALIKIYSSKSIDPAASDPLG
jgi:PAS domain S-box-containing protein